jgi:acyl-CoA reductase-like NAD-dependent aldehyde dehydrogenase
MTQPVSTQLFINGRWQSPEDSETFAVHNPARPSEIVGYAANACAKDVDKACLAAGEAFPSWSALSYRERAEYLRKVAAHLTSDKDELSARVHLFTREHGKVLKEANIEMNRFGDRFLMCAGYAERLEKNEELQGPPFDTVIMRQARGPAALIVPWNWPLSILGAKLPQALMAGNTVVIKLSQDACLAPTQTIGRLAALLPPGVVNLITGDPSRIGEPLLTHPAIKQINFTGSVRIGKYIMQKAAENLLPTTLELGGNDAGLILDDAILDAPALQRIYLASFMSTGQICMALKRIYVHRSRYEELVNGLIAVASKQVVGDGLLPETTMGPINNSRQYETVMGMINEAKEAGADVRELGVVPNQQMYEDGYFQKPTLVLNPAPSLRVVCEEQFGPVVPIIPFDTEEEAIRYANDSEFGLCSSVWTVNQAKALELAQKLEAGYTYINGHGPLAQDGRAPFGGFKNSGIGRNLGYEGILSFQESHAISGPEGTLL